jgi:hypothetical protein
MITDEQFSELIIALGRIADAIETLAQAQTQAQVNRLFPGSVP